MFDLPPLPDAALRGIVLSLIGLGWVIVLTRVVGLRTFSKMTAFDFVVTLATGSLLATGATATRWTGFVQAMAAIMAITACQVALALIRRRSHAARAAMENQPLLLMRDGRFIEPALAQSRVARADVLAKLRGANVATLAEVRAVVLESTGDISVLHGEAVAPELIEPVRER